MARKQTGPYGEPNTIILLSGRSIKLLSKFLTVYRLVQLSSQFLSAVGYG